jgi:hypothetical protein
MHCSKINTVDGRTAARAMIATIASTDISISRNRVVVDVDKAKASCLSLNIIVPGEREDQVKRCRGESEGDTWIHMPTHSFLRYSSLVVGAGQQDHFQILAQAKPRIKDLT